MSLRRDIENLGVAFNGRFGLHALHLQGNDPIVSHSADERFPTASAVKLPVLITLMAQVENGRFSLDHPLMLRHADQIGGSGILRHLTPGLTMCLRDWACLMMKVSDNTATNVLIDHVGLENVQAWLRDNGYDDVELRHKLDFDRVAQDQHHFGSATPRGLTRMITAVFHRQLVSPTACDEMLRMMDMVGDDRVGRYLPFAPFAEEVADEEKLHLAGKTGSFKGTRVQTAVVWRGNWQDRLHPSASLPIVQCTISPMALFL